MLRIARILPFLALATVPLASCLHERGTCSTCPAERSARIQVNVPARTAPPNEVGMDSVTVQVVGAPLLSVRQGRSGVIENLARGTHDVTVVRWFSVDNVPSSKTTQLQIVLLRAEKRTIVFHNDFPLVVWSPVPAGERLRFVATDPSAIRRAG